MPAAWTAASAPPHRWRHVERVGLGERATACKYVLVERSSFEELHDQVGGAGFLEDLEDANDAGVGEPGEDGGLTEETVLCRRERLGAARWRCDHAAVAHGTVAEQLLQRDRPP